MHVPIDVSYLRFKKLTLSYLIANDIVYFLCKFLKHKIVYTQIASYTYVLYYICNNNNNNNIYLKSNIQSI